MNIVVFGATDMIGTRIAADLEQRGHTETAATRATGADATDPRSVASVAAGADAVVSAVSARGVSSTFHGTVRSDSTGSSFVSRWDLYGQISGDSRKITGVMTAEDTHGMPCIDPVPYSTHLARTTPGGSSRRCAPVLSGPRAISDIRATNITCARVRRALRKWPSSVPFQFICVKHEGRRRECRWLGEKFGFSVS